MKTLIHAGFALSLLGGQSFLVQPALAQSSLAQSTYGPAQSGGQMGAQIGVMPPAPDSLAGHDRRGPAGSPDNSPDRATRLSPGDRVPDDYQQEPFVVSTWKTYGLESPPAGYRWLRDDRGGQYLLTSVTNGRIVDTVDQMRPDGPRDPGMAMVDGPRHDGNPQSGMHWSRGDHVPDANRGDDHVVGDWRERNLAPPARGDTWIRNESGQYAMVDRHGMVADVVLQDRYRGDYAWSRGEQLSGGYLDARFTVTDWQGAGLPRPAHGSHWVNINHHYMLISRRTGVISDIRDAGQ